MEHGPKVIRDAGLLDRLSALGRWFGGHWSGRVPLPGYVTTAGAGTRRLGSAWLGINRYSRLHHHRETANTNTETLKVFGGAHGNKVIPSGYYATVQTGPEDSPSEFIIKSHIYNGHNAGDSVYSRL